MAAKRRRAVSLAQYDVDLGSETTQHEASEAIMAGILLKGFCTIRDPKVTSLMKQAEADVLLLETMDRFERTPDLIIDGLLGVEGSDRIAELEQEGEQLATLADLDLELSSITELMTRQNENFGIDLGNRTTGLVHEASKEQADSPSLQEHVVKKWVDIFAWHRIMLLMFLGPGEGSLELQPFDPECTAHKVWTEPGMLVALRADMLWHSFSCPVPKSYIMSCFIQQNGRVSINRSALPPFIPVVEQLNKWSEDHLKDIVKNWDEDDVENLDIEWRGKLDHMFNRQQYYAVRGTGVKVVGTWDPQESWQSCVPGFDAGQEVPLRRWDHDNYYLADLESWKVGKVYASHGMFIEGMHLFDSKFFRISPAETKGMDPQQRMIMDTGYEALYRAGRNSKNLLQSLTAVYVSVALTEWAMVDQGPEEAGGCEQRAAGTGLSGSIMSNRFSFVFGMNGPSVSFDTDASGVLCTIDHAINSLNPEKVNATMSNCTGCSTMLTPLTWIVRCGLGHFSMMGRCFTFDAGAQGFVRGEGCGSIALDNYWEEVDGEKVLDDSKPCVGRFDRVNVKHTGQGASLFGSHGPSQQSLIAESLRMGRIASTSIDAVECMGDGNPMNDAIEIESLSAVYFKGDQEGRKSLVATAAKTNYGNSIQYSGIAQVFKVLYCQRFGNLIPNVHLHEFNPQMEEPDSRPLIFPDENLLFASRTSIVTIQSYGWGGTQAHAICSGFVQPEYVAPPKPAWQLQTFSFWPGGGGQLEDDARPTNAYEIAGSWNAWQYSEPMESEGGGVFSYTLRLGANRFEQFQIWLDGDLKRVLHPEMHRGPSGSVVFGPEECPRNSCWMIDGRVFSLGKAEISGVSLKESSQAPAELSKVGAMYETTAGVGDEYRIRLSIAGKFRAVTWERISVNAEEVTMLALPSTPQQHALTIPEIEGAYYITGDFNCWTFEEMTRVKETPGLYRLELRLAYSGGEFQVARNQDPGQIFYPEDGTDCTSVVFGPSNEHCGASWVIDGEAGDVFEVEFQRSLDSGLDSRKINWRKVRHDQLSEEEELAAHRPRLFLVGSFGQWSSRKEMQFDGDKYRCEVTVGSTGEESFQIIENGDWKYAVYPATANAHYTEGYRPRGPDSMGHGLNWTIGQHPTEANSTGVTYEVELKMFGKMPAEVRWTRAGQDALPQPEPPAVTAVYEPYGE